MRLKLIEFTMKPNVGGAATGEAVFSRLVSATIGSDSEEIHFLDFEEMELATSSFLRTCVVDFRDFCVANRNGVVALANMNTEIAEEMKDLLFARRDAIAACDLTDSGQVVKPSIIGTLDEKQTIALDAISQGLSDTGAMHRNYAGGSSVSLAAWSNRLTALASKGLVVEVAKGRAKTYRLIFEGLEYGT